MTVVTYSPLRVSSTFIGQPITGWAKDSMVEVEYSEPGFIKHVGCDGKVTRTMVADTSGTAKFKLKASSPSNDMLMGLYKLDRVAGLGSGEFRVEDLNGTSEASASEAWIEKPPAFSRGKEEGEVEWTIALARLNLFVGGGYI